MHSTSWGIEAEMFGNLMIFPSGVLASSPNAANSSGTLCSGFSLSEKCAMRRPATEISRFSTWNFEKICSTLGNLRIIENAKWGERQRKYHAFQPKILEKIFSTLGNRIGNLRMTENAKWGERQRKYDVFQPEILEKNVLLWGNRMGNLRMTENAKWGERQRKYRVFQPKILEKM